MNGLPSGSTKDQLFLAAVKVFARKGYKGATVREICSLAGAANINSINYYFGGKEKLYEEILESIFSEYQKRKDRKKKIEKRNGVPEKHLRDFIDTYCDMLYNNGEIATDLSAIFIAEMSQPSSHLDEMTRKYMVPQADELTGILRNILGKKTPINIIRDCGVSIIGAIGYYGFTWPLLSRVYSDLPSMQSYHTHLAEHVFRFSMGGLRVVRRALAQEKMQRKRGEKTKVKIKRRKKLEK